MSHTRLVCQGARESKSVDRGYPRLRRHSFRGDNHYLSARLQNNFRHIVEQVVHIRLEQGVKLDLAG